MQRGDVAVEALHAKTVLVLMRIRDGAQYRLRFGNTPNVAMPTGRVPEFGNVPPCERSVAVSAP